MALNCPFCTERCGNDWCEYNREFEKALKENEVIDDEEMNKLLEAQEQEEEKALQAYNALVDKLTLHDLTVRVEGREVVISANMLKFQKKLDNLPLLKKLHIEKLLLYAQMDDEDDPEQLAYCAQLLTKLEYDLQDAWGFERNVAFHKFWEAPKCICPKKDNELAHPTGYYSFNNICPVHSTALDLIKDSSAKVLANVDFEDYEDME